MHYRDDTLIVEYYLSRCTQSRCFYARPPRAAGGSLLGTRALPASLRAYKANPSGGRLSLAASRRAGALGAEAMGDRT
jgi:hypothetical protein